MFYLNNPKTPAIGDQVRVLLDDGTAPFGELVDHDGILEAKVIENPTDPATAEVHYYNFAEYEILLAEDTRIRDPQDPESLEGRGDIEDVMTK